MYDLWYFFADYNLQNLVHFEKRFFWLRVYLLITVLHWPLQELKRVVIWVAVDTLIEFVQSNQVEVVLHEELLVDSC